MVMKIGVGISKKRLAAVVLAAIMAVCIDCPAASFAQDDEGVLIYSADNWADGVHLVWSEDQSCDGYRVYRRAFVSEPQQEEPLSEDQEAAPNEWELVLETETRNDIEGTDITAEDGKYYEYAVASVTFPEEEPAGETEENSETEATEPAETETPEPVENELSKPISIVYLQQPQVSIKRVSSRQKKISWSESAAEVAGYEIQYSRHRTMRSRKTVTAAGDKTSITAKKLSKNKVYYARVRSFIEVDDQVYYSQWGMTPNGTTDKVISKTILKYKYKKNGKTKKATLDIPVYAGQGVKDNSIMQGGCTDGKYAYFALINNQGTSDKADDTQKIAKVKLSTAKVVALSDFLELDHANDMTYDPENQRIVVLHNLGHAQTRKRLSFVDPDSLEVTGYVDVPIPSVLPGNSSYRLKQIVGYCSIAYSPEREQYVILMSTFHNFMITDKDFNPIKYVRIDESMKTINDDWYCQGMDCTKDYILLAESARTNRKKNYNMLMMYDWDGDLKCRIKVRREYEIENVFHVGDTWYTGFYTYHKVNKKYRRSGYVYKFSNF